MKKIYHLRRTEDGANFQIISRYSDPLSAICAMRREVKRQAFRFVNELEDFNLYQTSDERWPDAWGYANNGYTFEHNGRILRYEVVNIKELNKSDK